MNLSSLSIENYLHKFKKYPKATTLFEPTKNELVQSLIKRVCPHCGCKLYPLRNGKLWICKSKRKDGYRVKTETLAKYF